MGSFLCKIWMFILNVVDAVIDGIANALINLVEALGVIFSAIWGVLSDAVGSIFDGAGGWLLLAAGVAAAFFLFGGDDDEKQTV